MKVIVIGCGLAGSVAARLLKDKGHEVKIFESRSHIAGNCFDTKISGVLVHKFGPHIFHTNDEEVYGFLSRFTEWEDFKYRPIGITNLGEIPLPYSDYTSPFKLSNHQIQKYIFKDYSEKQWGTNFKDIPKKITSRIPKTKHIKNPTWFEGEKYQCIPKHGYTQMFKKMLEGIDVKLNSKPDDWKFLNYDLMVYTGKIDEFYNYKFGELPYRSLTMKFETSEKKLNNFVYNECNSQTKHTRKYDHSYLNKNHTGDTIITYEYPKKCERGDIPFYPIPWGEGTKTYSKYKKLTNRESKVIFLGRLATYQYLDMWMIVKQAINKIKKIK